MDVQAEARAKTLAQYLDVLTASGYKARLDEGVDIDLIFQAEGAEHWLLVDDKDFEVVCILLPNFWQTTENEVNELELLRVANLINSQRMLVKIFKLQDQEIWCASMEILATPETLAPRVSFVVNSIQWAIHNFAEEMLATTGKV